MHVHVHVHVNAQMQMPRRARRAAHAQLRPTLFVGSSGSSTYSGSNQNLAAMSTTPPCQSASPPTDCWRKRCVVSVEEVRTGRWSGQSTPCTGCRVGACCTEIGLEACTPPCCET